MKSEVIHEKLCFWTDGESFTRLLRDLWDSGEIEKVCTICMDSSKSDKEKGTHLAVNLCTGKWKLEGDSRTETGLYLEEDGEYTTYFTPDIIRTNLEKQYCYTLSEISIRLRRMKTADIPDAEGAFYRVEKVDNWSAYSQYKYDHEYVKKNKEKLSKIIQSLDYLYLYIGKDIGELAFLNAGEDGFSEIELKEHQRRWGKINRFREDLKSGRSNRYTWGETECEVYKYDIKEKLKPSTLENEQNGWISPSGDFYSCPPMGHINLGVDLKIIGIVPEEINNETGWLEDKGWMKLQDGKFVRFVNRTDFEELLNRGSVLSHKQLDLIVTYWMNNPKQVKSFNYDDFVSISDFYNYLSERYGLEY